MQGLPTTPYVYQEFPRILHAPDGQTCIVYDTAEKDAALKAGWLLIPVVSTEPSTAAAVQAPASVDLLALPEAQLTPMEAPGKRGPGRPKKETNA